MQRILSLFVVLTLGLTSIAQTSATTKSTVSCESKNTLLLSNLGAVSAVTVYNTYLALGAVCDGYVYKAYTETKAKELFEEQINMMEALVDNYNKLLDDKAVTDSDDIYFVQELATIVKSLKRQAELFNEYLGNKTDAKKTAYDNQRRKSWDRIAKLLELDK